MTMEEGNILILRGLKVVKTGRPALLIPPMILPLALTFQCRGGIREFKKSLPVIINEQLSLWHGECALALMYVTLRHSAMQ